MARTIPDSQMLESPYFQCPLSLWVGIKKIQNKINKK